MEECAFSESAGTFIAIFVLLVWHLIRATF